MPGMSKEAILATIQECAQKIGRTPYNAELRDFCPAITRATIRMAFGTYTQALREAGLEALGRGVVVPLELLLRDWAEVARKLEKLPSMAEYEATSKYSVRPLVSRFKGWPHVPRGLEEYMVSQGLEGEYEDVLVMIRERRAAESAQTPAPTWWPAKRERLPGAGKIFGTPLTATPLAFGPTNEQGVVFLFGMVAERLGFVVIRIQTEFPDGEALMRLDEDQWQHVRIEFEYESRNFLKHQHERSDCDVIVCWNHNWPDCPLEVVELKGVAKGMVGQGGDGRTAL
jgi:hypothetical protein